MIERKAFFEVLLKSSKTSVTEYVVVFLTICLSSESLDNNQETLSMEIVMGGKRTNRINRLFLIWFGKINEVKTNIVVKFCFVKIFSACK